MSKFFLLLNIFILILVMILQTVILIWGKKYTNNKLKEIKNFVGWKIVEKQFRKKYFKILLNFSILYFVELLSLTILLNEYFSKH